LPNALFQPKMSFFSERPIVCSQFAWNEFYKYSACEFCMKSLENVQENVCRLSGKRKYNLSNLECGETDKDKHVKCPKCQIDYCSEECRVAAWLSYHETLCLGADRLNPDHFYNMTMEAWRCIHMPPETTTLNLIFKLVAMIKQSENKEKIIQALYNFEYSLVDENQNLHHKLLSTNFFNQLENVRLLSFDLFKSHYYVKECEPWFSDLGFKQLFCLFGRNSQGVGTSPLSVWVRNVSKLNVSQEQKEKLDELINKVYDDVEEESGAFLNSEGSALYELQSKINHSCSPNCEIIFKDNSNVLTLRALKNIQQGDEISISYLDECDLCRSRHSRQKLLKGDYLFVCQCEKCLSEADQPEETSEEDDDDDDEEFEDEDMED